jgi:hypothetical protein
MHEASRRVSGRPAPVLLRCLHAVCMCVEMSKLCEYGARLFIMCKALCAHAPHTAASKRVWPGIKNSKLHVAATGAGVQHFYFFTYAQMAARRVQFAFDLVIF